MSEVFEYALIRVVPRVERGEAMNAGVIVYAKSFRYLATKIRLDERRLLALDPAKESVVPAGHATLAVRHVLPFQSSVNAVKEPVLLRLRTAPVNAQFEGVARTSQFCVLSTFLGALLTAHQNVTVINGLPARFLNLLTKEIGQ